FSSSLSFFLFYKATATTEIYTLSLHDALPICSSSISATRSRSSSPGRRRSQCRVSRSGSGKLMAAGDPCRGRNCSRRRCGSRARSEEHTSELQSLAYLVCRLLLEKKKLDINNI